MECALNAFPEMWIKLAQAVENKCATAMREILTPIEIFAIGETSEKSIDEFLVDGQAVNFQI